MIEMVEYLVANGANPSQRSQGGMGHDLIDEIEFWQPQYPQFHNNYEKVRLYLKANGKKLFADYVEFKRCEDEMD